jgi:hypothetical protein
MVLNFISFKARNGEHFFHVLFSHLYFFLWKSSVQFSCPFLYWVIDFGGNLVFELSVYSGYQSLIWCIASKDFLPFCRWPLQVRDHFFCCAEQWWRYHNYPTSNYTTEPQQ